MIGMLLDKLVFTKAYIFQEKSNFSMIQYIFTFPPDRTFSTHHTMHSAILSQPWVNCLHIKTRMELKP